MPPSFSPVGVAALRVRKLFPNLEPQLEPNVADARGAFRLCKAQGRPCYLEPLKTAANLL